jgi:hypothetical protein
MGAFVRWIDKAAAAVMMGGLCALVASTAPAAAAEPPKEAVVTVFGLGNALWDWCGQTNVGQPPDACWLYVAGASDGFLLSARPAPYCLPAAGANVVQITDVVRKYLLAHPEKRSQPAAVLVREALKEGFPCS